MKLLTDGIIKKLPKIKATDGLPASKRKIIVKFFNLRTNWRWYILEGQQLENGDWELYGYVKGFDSEFGYVLLSELQSVRSVERDMYFGNPTLQEVLDGKVF